MIHLIIDADNEKDLDFTSILADKSFKVLYTQNIVTIKDDELAQAFSTIFEKLKFKPLVNGTRYLKIAIIIAYTDQDLLYKNKKLIELISKEKNIKPKTIRNAIERSITHMYKHTSIATLKEVFGESYEGEKLSVKDFIALCVNQLNIATGKSPVNMYNFK